MRAFIKSSKREKWTGGLELLGMVLILVSFYYQAFYEGNNLAARYDNIRFKLELIQNEVIHSSYLDQKKTKYDFGNLFEGFNDDREDVNKISEDYISSVDKINEIVSAIRAWMFIAGSLLLIVSKYFQYFWKPENDIEAI